MSKNLSVFVAAGRIVLGSGVGFSSLTERSSEDEEGEVSGRLEPELADVISVALFPEVAAEVSPFVDTGYVLGVKDVAPDDINDGGTDGGAPKKELSSRVSRKSLLLSGIRTVIRGIHQNARQNRKFIPKCI